MVVSPIEGLFHAITDLELSIIAESQRYVKNRRFTLRLFGLLGITYNSKMYGLPNAVGLALKGKYQL